MDNRVYLDNCSFNRPYDDQTILRNYLESEAKTYIQLQIINKVFELAWSYMMDYEISFNPFDNRRNQIQKWKNVTKINIQYSENNILLAKEIQKQKIKVKDSIHIACAIEAECKYYITTDDKLLNKNIDNIIITDPINFIKQMGV
ncbi:MAG: PIN domain protein [Treponema sp.]|jgi:predicted nucleic acid-binding protein|nr:PIN domain protein [Treponema sp.]